MLVSGEKGIQKPPALCDNKEENKDHVYAVVHKERKGRASSKASTLKTPSDRPQEGTRGSPVNRGSYVDCVDRSSHPTDSGLGNNAKAAESKTPHAGGNIEYLYAAVDKTKRKKKPPQVIHFTNPNNNFFCFVFLMKTCLTFNAFESKEKILTHSSLRFKI